MNSLNLLCDVISHTEHEIIIRDNEKVFDIGDEAHYIIEKMGNEYSFYEFEDDGVTVTITL